jgi:multicomponent Na+:H+ antiporter subunit B
MIKKASNNLVKRTIARVLIPFIQLFALYVIVHGDSGPGGGFQGGVILAASIILYSIVYGLPAGRKWISQKVTDVFNSIGVLLYAGVGFAALLAGGNYLEYGKLPGFHDLHHAAHYGIFFIEVGVGITVASVMITIFFETADRSSDVKKVDSDA